MNDLNAKYEEKTGKKIIQGKGYNAHFVESPLLLQELNEAGYLAMELHNHSGKPCKEKKMGKSQQNGSPTDSKEYMTKAWFR